MFKLMVGFSEDEFRRDGDNVKLDMLNNVGAEELDEEIDLEEL